MLEGDPISPSGHRKSQEATHGQARADDAHCKEGEKKSGSLEFVETELKQAEVIRAADKEAPDCRTLLHTAERVDGETAGQADENVDAQTDSGHAWSKQPEALAQAFAFGGYNAARCPDRSQQVHKDYEEQGSGYIDPIGKEGRSN